MVDRVVPSPRYTNMQIDVRTPDTFAVSMRTRMSIDSASDSLNGLLLIWPHLTKVFSPRIRVSTSAGSRRTVNAARTNTVQLKFPIAA